jgi:hypothetical protein
LHEEQIGKKEIDLLRADIALPIREIIRYCMVNLNDVFRPENRRRWPDDLFRLINREDVLNNIKQFGPDQKNEKESGKQDF